MVVVATAVGILLGQAQGVEWGETPVWIDPVAQLGLLLVAINFMPPDRQGRGPLYVTLWYFLAAFVWTFLTYAMGNFIPQYFVAGTAAGAVGGLFIHDLVGLFVTPLGWGLMYYFVPILLKKPIWSHGLSLVGFWGLAFFYPLDRASTTSCTRRFRCSCSTGRSSRPSPSSWWSPTVIINFLRDHCAARRRRWSRTCRSAGSTPAWSSTS